MGDNGSNEYDVTFGRVMFLQGIIERHDNTISFIRHDDIVFDINRREQNDTIQVVCVDEYTLSESMARRIIGDFPDVSVIFVGGKWNRPAHDATLYCRAKKIGVSNAGDINATLRKTQFWR